MKPSSIPENYNSASSPPTNWDVFFLKKEVPVSTKKNVCVFQFHTVDGSEIRVTTWDV